MAGGSLLVVPGPPEPGLPKTTTRAAATIAMVATASQRRRRAITA
jgi:hypothetical protein